MQIYIFVTFFFLSEVFEMSFFPILYGEKVIFLPKPFPPIFLLGFINTVFKPDWENGAKKKKKHMVKNILDN